MMKFFDWVMVITAALVLALILAKAISDAYSPGIKKAGWFYLEQNKAIEQKK